MKLVVFAILSLFLRSPLASGAAFTASGSCHSHGQRRLQSRSCSYRPTLFLNNAADDDVDWENANPDDDEKIYSRRDLLRILRDKKDLVAVLNQREKRRLALDWGRQFITSIMNATVEPIPNSNGMSLVRNIYKLETNEARHIILRNITTKFWKACIDAVNIPRRRVAAVGTPGIGKTTSTPWLIRMLLEQGETVVYLIRTEKESSWYYEFVPVRRNNITVNIYPEALAETDIPSLRRSSTYYAVDPGESKNSCNPPFNFPAKVIIVSSPDSRHWGGSGFEKNRDGVRGEIKYFPTWSYEELLIARPILCPNMTEDQLHDRFVQFGGVPKNVFEWDVNFLLRAQNRAVAALSAEIAKEIALGQMDASDAFGEHTKSSLLAFRLSGEDVGTFQEGESYIVSVLAFEKIYYKYQKELWNVMLDLGPNGGGGIIFELITRYMMAIRVPPMEFECRRCVGKSNKNERNTYFWLTLGTGMKDIRQVIDPTMAATTLAGIVFHPIIPNHALFDFVYKDLNGHYHFFQTTIGETHDANETNIEKLEKTVGASNMSFYFLVPSKIFPKFVTDPVEPAVSCNIYHVSIPSPRDQQSSDDEQAA